MKKSWFSISAIAAQAAGAKPAAEISIHDVIGLWGVSVKDFANELRALGEIERIDLSIHSPGGSVTDGWAIYNILKAHPAPVHARVEGLAASMASVILMAADKVTIPANAYVMIHNPHIAGYEADELRALAAEINDELAADADLLDKMRGGILSAYAARTGQDESELSELMDKETWLDGTEAVLLGFADVLAEDVKAAALAPAWADYLDNIPAGAEIEPVKKARSGIIARLLGTDTPTAATAAADEAEALRVQLATARTDLAAAQAAAAHNAAEVNKAWAELDTATKALATATARVAELETSQGDFDSRLAESVTNRLQELGVPEGKLPGAADGDMGEEETVDSLVAKLAAEEDPKERFRIAARLTALRKKPRV